MRTILSAAAFAAVMGTCAGARAGSINMTTLDPIYLTNTGEYLPIVSPHYTQSATPDALTVIGKPNEGNSSGTSNNTPAGSLLLNGDFTASVTIKTGPNAGGVIDADFGSGGNFAGGGTGAGVVWANYGTDFGGVDTPYLPISGYTATFTLTRSGDTFSVYASTSGAYQHLLTLQGPAVAGPVGKIGLTAIGVPNVNEAETTILSNFYVINSASEDLSGLTGGTSDAPIMLPATPVSSVSGSIGGDSPDSEFYSFYWNGGAFAVSVAVRDAAVLNSPPTYLFELCNGTTCSDIIDHTTVDGDNDWLSGLSGDLAAGYYTVGIIDQTPAADPNFVITFAEPLSQIAGVPEPSTWAMMLLGFAGLGYAGFRRASKITLA